MTPRATYRLQLHKHFGFAAAAALAPHLARLGISHVYCSPYLKARPGSTHGYDIVDHAALNPELGSDDDFATMCATFRAHGLGQILDFVPNHMGVGGADNPIWLEVLEWGRESAYAGWFDVDWEPDRHYLHDKLLTPLLGEQYGVELEAGKLVLRFDDIAGAFAVWAYDAHKLPISPFDYATILGDHDPALERIADAFADLAGWRPEVVRRADELKRELAVLVHRIDGARAAVDEAVAALNGTPGEPDTFDSLDALIARQWWRVASFRAAADDINYRRFFNINELAGLRIELPAVFDHAHKKVSALLADGTLDGLRIDHIDGLLDPKAYLTRLRGVAPEPRYIVVEKILAPHESLREDWPVDGTTGYEFTNQVLGVLIDPSSEAAFSRTYASFTGLSQAFADIVRASKIRIMEHEMASELNVLARDVARVARQNRRTGDFTRHLLHRALKEVVACFPVYRTYRDTNGPPTDADRRDIDWAVAQARRYEDALDPALFDFLHQALSGELVARPHSGFRHHSVLRLAMRLQQYCGPVMAKGLEDTAFYRYNRFVALNEVGGNPAQFGTSIATFHKANRTRAQRWPRSMLTTATHDTKRGEDTRARLAALSEFPDEWQQQVTTWSRILRARLGDVEGRAPPAHNDEYLLYQLLVGTWPVEMLDGEPLPSRALVEYAERIKGAMIKSVREAKVHSTWALQNNAYETAMTNFVDSALDATLSAAFFAAFVPFATRIARLGAHNSLIQTVLKLTSPGVPDIYQGGELWDLNLVDPDNRRPVAFDRHAALAREVVDELEEDRPAAMRRYLQDWKDGRAKLALLVTLLGFRTEHAHLFDGAGYEGLAVEGTNADQVCAFARTNSASSLVTAVARFPRRLQDQGLSADTWVRVPADPRRRIWRDLLSGAEFCPRDDGLRAAELFAALPAAVLVSQ